MKFLFAATLAFSILGSGVIATAAAPCGTSYGYSPSYGSNSLQYGYGTQLGYVTQYSYSPQYGYGAAQSYGGYQNVLGYPQSSAYGQSWNTMPYRSPTYTYDPVHGDYHFNQTYQARSYNHGFGGHSSVYGSQYGGNRGW